MSASPELTGRSELRYAFDAGVGERVTILRKRVGKSQKDLARALEITEGTMSEKISSGPWYGWELGIIAELVESTLDVLYGITDMPPAPVASIAGRRRRASVGRTGLEPVTDGSWVAPVTDLDGYRARRSA